MKIRSFADIKSLFLDNRTIKQTVVKNTFWLAFAEGVCKLLKLFLLIYIARILGAAEYGKFSFALAFIGLFTIFANLGLPRIVVREISQGKDRENEFSSILSLRVILSFVMLAMILIGSLFITADPVIREIIWILAVYIILDGLSNFVNLFFQAVQRMEYESWAKIFKAAVLTGFGFFVIFTFPALGLVKNLSYGYLLASLVSLIIIFLFLHLKVHPISFSLNAKIWKKYLIMSWPLALAGFFTTLYGQVDSVMMGYLNQITETGWYNAAYRIIGAAVIPIGLISTPIYPVLSKAFNESKEKFQKAWNYQMEIMILLSFPVVVGGIILAPRIITLVYGSSYFPSILVFQILILMAGISFLHNPFSHALLVSRQQKKFFWVTLLGVITNLGLNIVLIPRYSLYGAASATVATSFVLLIAFVVFTKKSVSLTIVNMRIFWTIILSSISAFIMYIAISAPAVYNLHVFISVIIGAVIYFGVFFGIKFSFKNINYFKR